MERKEKDQQRQEQREKQRKGGWKPKTKGGEKEEKTGFRALWRRSVKSAGLLMRSASSQVTKVA